MNRGPLAVRTWERSSSQSMSRTQCSRSSMAQWPRMMAASWVGLAWVTVSDGDRVAGLGGPLLLQPSAAHDLNGLGGVGEGQPGGHRGDFEVRRSARPLPRSRVSQATGTWRQGRAASWACRLAGFS
jgi:hypothetical protein